MYKDKLPFSSLSHEECHKKLLEYLEENHYLGVQKFLLIVLLILSLIFGIYSWYARKQDSKEYIETYKSIRAEKIEAQKSADYYLGYSDGRSSAASEFSEEKGNLESSAYINGYQQALEDSSAPFQYYDAYWKGNEDGYFQGYEDGHYYGYDEGWEDGHDSGYDAGYRDGYSEGNYDAYEQYH